MSYETVKTVNGIDIYRMKGTRGAYHVTIREGKNFRESHSFRTIKAATEFVRKVFPDGPNSGEMKGATHDQYFVGVIFRYEWDKGDRTFRNALAWYPNKSDGARYVRTKEKAKMVLEYVLELWNGPKSYDANGERRETMQAGYIGIDTVHTKDSDRDLNIVAYTIKHRTVTEWDVLENEEI